MTKDIETDGKEVGTVCCLFDIKEKHNIVLAASNVFIKYFK